MGRLPWTGGQEGRIGFGGRWSRCTIAGLCNLLKMRIERRQLKQSNAEYRGREPPASCSTLDFDPDARCQILARLWTPIFTCQEPLPPSLSALSLVCPSVITQVCEGDGSVELHFSIRHRASCLSAHGDASPNSSYPTIARC